MRGIHDGSVYERTETRYVGGKKKAVRVWFARVRYTDGDGQKREKKRRAASQTEATKLKATLYAEIEAELTAPAHLTVGAWLDRWLKLKSDDLSERTHVDYTDRLRLYVRPLLAKKDVRALTPAEVQEVYDKMRAEGLSARSIEYVHAILRAALGDAERLEIIARNPALKTLRPKKQSSAKAVLSPAQIPFWRAAASEDEHALLWEIALGLALRPEEYLGLQWRDVDWTAGRLSIERALVKRRSGGGWYFKPPKTEHSVRLLAVPASLLARLREHRQAQRAMQLAAPVWESHDLIFCTQMGTPLAQNNLTNRNWRRILKRANVLIRAANEAAPHAAPIPVLPLTGLGLYTLRHTGASQMERIGVPVKILSEILGHHSAAFTLDTYVKTDVSQHTQAAALIDAAMRRTG